MKPVLFALGLAAAFAGATLVTAYVTADPVQKPVTDGVGTNPGGVLTSTVLQSKPGRELAVLGAGCFWGIETAMRKVKGVTATAVGYAGGVTKNPTYEQICTGRTKHAEIVIVEFDPAKVSYDKILNVYWEWHNPTTLNRQGPDVGDQYRSVIFTFNDKQIALAKASRAREQKNWKKPVVTEILPVPAVYKAEAYHQQYDAKTGHFCPPPRTYPVGD